MLPVVAGLYAVTPDTDDTPRLVARTGAAIAGGARLIQYRNKTADAALRMMQARALLDLCRGQRIPLIVNDHLDLALALDADGVHLGADDGSLREARAQLGSRKLLGASCYARLDAALDAAGAGADYVAFGRFFASGTKPGAVHAPLALLGEARQRLALPVVAIGGITVDNAKQVIAAGAHSVAVVSAVFDAPDVASAARCFSALFDERPHPRAELERRAG